MLDLTVLMSIRSLAKGSYRANAKRRCSHRNALFPKMISFLKVVQKFGGLKFSTILI